MLATQEELDEVKGWCVQKKAERQGGINIIERNPFSSRFDWTRNIISIEIDRPTASAMKTSLVYDSITKRLYRYINSTWIELHAGKANSNMIK